MDFEASAGPTFSGHGGGKHQNWEKEVNEVNFLSLVSVYPFTDQKEKSGVSKDRSELCQGYLRTSGGSRGGHLSTWPSEWCCCSVWPTFRTSLKSKSHQSISYTWWDFEEPLSRYDLWDMTQGSCCLWERNHSCKGKTWNYQELEVSSIFF